MTALPERPVTILIAALGGEEVTTTVEGRERYPVQVRYARDFRDDPATIARLLVGSEGTLAFVTEATLATDPIPAHRGVVLLLFDRLENAARAVQEVLTLSPAACDLMDRRHLSLARETDGVTQVVDRLRIKTR